MCPQINCSLKFQSLFQDHPKVCLFSFIRLNWLQLHSSCFCLWLLQLKWKEFSQFASRLVTVMGSGDRPPVFFICMPNVECSLLRLENGRGQRSPCESVRCWRRGEELRGGVGFCYRSGIYRTAFTCDLQCHTECKLNCNGGHKRRCKSVMSPRWCAAGAAAVEDLFPPFAGFPSARFYVLLL